MEIKSDFLPLGRLLEGDRTYEIPEFQRPFAWEAKHIDEFWADIVDVPESGHFLGPMVFCVDDDNSSSVIDGQQRLTAVQLLLATIRDSYVLLDDPKRPDTGIPYSGPVNSFIMNGTYQVGTKLKTSEAQREVLEQFMLLPLDNPNRKKLDVRKDFASLTPKQKTLSKPLRKAYERLGQLLTDKIKDLTTDEKILELDRIEHSLVNRVSVVAMKVTDLEDAFNLFESLNDKGLRLSAADLLKSHLLGKLKNSLSEAQIDAYLASWDELVDGLGGGDITAFLRHYLLSRVPGRRVRKEDVFPLFKKFVKDEGAEPTLKSVLQNGNAYAPLLDPPANDPAYELLLRLRGTGVDSQRIALLAGRQVLSEPGFSQLAQLIESMSFRWTVGGKNAQNLENIYQAIAHILRSDGAAGLTEIKRQIAEQLPSDADFRAAFLALTPSRALARYALRRFEEELFPSEKALKPAQKVHVEHMMPLTKTAYWSKAIASDADYAETVARWGNLTLLGSSLNQSIKNADWPLKKRDGYASSEIRLTKSLLHFETWTDELIDLRSRWLAYLAPFVWGGSLPSKNPVLQFELVADDLSLIDS